MISNGVTVKPQLQTEATRVQVIIDLRGTMEVCPEFGNVTRVLRCFAELQGCVSTEYFSRATKFDFRARNDANVVIELGDGSLGLIELLADPEKTAAMVLDALQPQVQHGGG